MASVVNPFVPFRGQLSHFDWFDKLTTDSLRAGCGFCVLGGLKLSEEAEVVFE
jgi:hypothetical protein